MPAHNYQTVFRALPVAIQIMDRDWIIVDATEEYLRVTMRTREELIGRGIFDVFPPLSQSLGSYEILKASFQRVLDTGRAERLPPFVYPVRSPFGDAVIEYWRASNTPIFDSAGNVGGVINMVEDMTDAVNRQHQRDELAATLADTLAAIGTSAFQLQHALKHSVEAHSEINEGQPASAEDPALTSRPRP